MMIEPAPHELSRTAFITKFGGIYEHSSWVAETLYDQGLSEDDGDPTRLAKRMAAIVDASGNERQMALLCAHPELAGKLAISGSLTAESAAEQASAKLDKYSAKEFAEFHALNEQYQKKFGHPFIIAVRGLDRKTILAIFRKRVTYSKNVEFANAFKEVHKIALQRIKRLVNFN